MSERVLDSKPDAQLDKIIKDEVGQVNSIDYGSIIGVNGHVLTLILLFGNILLFPDLKDVTAEAFPVLVEVQQVFLLF